jgi:hypothetical protein
LNLPVAPHGFKKAAHKEIWIMPSKTPKQHRAMAAAASGKSNIGIPKKVGAEFMKADKAQGAAKKGAARKK